MKNIMRMSACPECGASMRLSVCRASRYILWTRYEVDCLMCGYQGKRAFTPRGAVEKWNKEHDNAKIH